MKLQPDKYTHIFAGGLIASLMFYLCVPNFDMYATIIIAITISILAGIAREIVNKSGFDIYDIIATGSGGILGTVAMWIIHFINLWI